MRGYVCNYFVSCNFDRLCVACVAGFRGDSFEGIERYVIAVRVDGGSDDETFRRCEYASGEFAIYARGLAFGRRSFFLLLSDLVVASYVYGECEGGEGNHRACACGPRPPFWTYT